MVTKEKNIGDYRTVWLKCELTSSDRHQLFLKEHKIQKQEPEFPRGRTLFLLNLPPYATVSSLRAAFSRHCGHVKFVKLTSCVASTKSGFKTAYIVFAKESQLEKALSLPKDFMIVLNSPEAPCLFGVKKWIKEYNSSMILNEDEVKESIEKYMAAYDEKVKAEEDEEMDEDGFTKVSSKKKRGQFAPQRKESTIEERRKKMQKKKELVHFYQFQIRETKKQQLIEMRKKFELDKQKVLQLKSQRIFKPFG